MTLDCSNYRPISSLLTFIQIVEKCVYKYVYSFLEKSHLSLNISMVLGQVVLPIILFFTVVVCLSSPNAILTAIKCAMNPHVNTLHQNLAEATTA